MKTNYAPKFRKLESEIREKIESRVWQPGRQIPTEAELCVSFNVSKTTVRAAITELVLQGLLERVQGKGTFVAEENRVETITLVGWGPAEKPFDRIWEDIRKSFSKKYPQLKVNIIPVPYAKLRNWLIEHVSMGRAPDIAQIDSAWDLEFAALGMTQPLDKLIRQEAQQDLLPALKRLSSFKGSLYAWPEAPMPFYLYCNKRLREKAGFFKAPETLEELAEQARAIAAQGIDSRVDDRIWGLTIDTYPWVWCGNSFLPILYNFGGKEMDEKGKICIESAETAEALEWCQALADEEVLGPLNTSIVDARKLFGKGQSGFYVDHPGGRAQAARQHTGPEPFDDCIEVVLFPREKRREHLSIAALWDFVIFKQSENMKNAALFLEWITDDPAIVGRYFDVTGGLPPTQSALKEKRYQDRFSIPVLEQIKTAKRPFEARPDKQVELAEALSYIVRSVIIDGMSISQALSEGARIMRIITGEKGEKSDELGSMAVSAIWQS